ncbi:hypothetical protein GCM10010038_14380 [Glutamicibacter protophormiae]|nr:hypothetical protein GCM10010038_14380 [Glutamicibacter protophormiae]
MRGTSEAVCAAVGEAVAKLFGDVVQAVRARAVPASVPVSNARRETRFCGFSGTVRLNFLIWQARLPGARRIGILRGRKYCGTLRDIYQR